MIVYRIAHPEYAQDLSGYGAWMQGGRWNRKGEWMLYAAEHASLAILELLGHIRGVKEHMPYLITRIDLSGSSFLEIEDFTFPLPSNWSESVNGIQVTRQVGSEWLQKKASAVLKVPSVHSPFESNVLINPKHPDLEIRMDECRWYLHDFRLFKFNV